MTSITTRLGEVVTCPQRTRSDIHWDCWWLDAGYSCTGLGQGLWLALIPFYSTNEPSSEFVPFGPLELMRNKLPCALTIRIPTPDPVPLSGYPSSKAGGYIYSLRTGKHPEGCHLRRSSRSAPSPQEKIYQGFLPRTYAIEGRTISLGICQATDSPQKRLGCSATFRFSAKCHDGPV